MHNFFYLLFKLPDGSIWSNLIASVLWGAGAVGIAYFMHSRTGKKLDKRFDEHREHMETQLAIHLQDIKDHIDGSQGSSESDSVLPRD